MKVVTWNLDYAMQHKSQHDQAWDYLCNTIKPDVALLQEVKPPAWLPSQAIVFEEYTQSWGTAIYAPSLPLSQVHFPSDLGRGRVVAASTLLGTVPVLLASIHAPTKGNVFPRLQKVFEKLEAMEHAHHAVIGGDLNSARLAEKVWPGYGHGTFWDRIDTGEVWIDCCRRFHSEELQTFFRERAHHQFQDDHIFVSRDFSECVRSCDPLNNPDVRSMSDHIPLIAELDLQ